MTENIHATIAGHLSDPAVAWSLGSFGAIAEFMWHDEESCHADGLSRVTPRGAIRIAPLEAAQLVQYTTPSRHSARQRSDAALCIPRDACSMSKRAVVTELGPDADALRPEERGHILFDMGLAQLNVDLLVRTGDEETLDTLRAAAGQCVFDPTCALMRDMPRLSPHRVFVTRCGRIEVYQGIPPADGRSPDGPHTHVLPKLLAAQRTHAANIPIPDGLVPCLTIHLSRPDPDHATKLADEGE